MSFSLFNQTQTGAALHIIFFSAQSEEERMRNAFKANLTCTAKEKKHQDYLLGYKHCHHSVFPHAAYN